MGLFGTAHEICHTYPTMMKLDTVVPYLKKIQKNINHMTNPMIPADLGFFHGKSVIFVIYRNTDIDYISMHYF